MHTSGLKVFFATLVWMELARAQAPATETTLHNFATPPKGAYPYAGFVADGAGNLYGTTSFGGPSGHGTVYKIDPSGRVRVLYSFTGGNDGSAPYAGVIRDAAGNLYGTTRYGGTSDDGTVYKIDASGQETVIHSFHGSDGNSPTAGVTIDSAGNLYGTTRYGGTSGYGTVYKIDASGQETVLHSFSGGLDGGNPYAGVIRDTAGNLYGTTDGGGTSNLGTVYKIDPSGHETVVHNFAQTDGAFPDSGLIRDSAGNLYGTTEYGGAANLGTVYKLDSSGQETVLHSFTGGSDGDYPSTGVIRDSAGNFYGTTGFGGSSDFGTVFKIDPSGQETVLYSFTGSDGGDPQASLLRDGAGNLYGTTFSGGASYGGTSAGYGTVFKINTAGQETVLYSFSSSDGRDSLAGVIRDGAGNLYGTTYLGGAGSDSGTVYKIDASGQETLLHSFMGGSDGANPTAGVIRDGAGNLYGTTQRGGAANLGTVFKIDAAGQETVLHSFAGGTDGANPYAGLIRDGAGNLYGTTTYGGGGPFGLGTVYKIDAGGQETVLHRFVGGADGANPYAGVIRDGSGNLYGTTEFGGAQNGGTVYKIDASGKHSVIYSFMLSVTDGAYPTTGVIRDPAGNLYGTAGGGAGYGSVYKIDPAGHETILYNFTGSGVNGEGPAGELLRDVTGNLYGTTEFGGTSVDVTSPNYSGYGTVYRIDSSGRFSVLYNFQGEADGLNPLAGLITDGPGNLLGTTSSGGTRNGGTVFKLDLNP